MFIFGHLLCKNCEKPEPLANKQRYVVGKNKKRAISKKTIITRKSNNKEKKSQNKLAEMIGKSLNRHIKQDFREFDWLRWRQNLEIDIWVPEIKLAIEYDGEQHFKLLEKFGGKEGFEKQKRYDDLKNCMIANHIAKREGDIEHFIRFRFDEPLYNYDYVLNKIARDFKKPWQDLIKDEEM